MKNRQRANADLFRRGVFNIEVARSSDDQRVLQSIGWLCCGGRCRGMLRKICLVGRKLVDGQTKTSGAACGACGAYGRVQTVGWWQCCWVPLQKIQPSRHLLLMPHERHGNIIPRCFLLDLCSVIEAPLTTLWRLSPNTVAGPLTDL